MSISHSKGFFVSLAALRLYRFFLKIDAIYNR